jgi:hypothetical protein
VTFVRSVTLARSAFANCDAKFGALLSGDAVRRAFFFWLVTGVTSEEHRGEDFFVGAEVDEDFRFAPFCFSAGATEVTVCANPISPCAALRADFDAALLVVGGGPLEEERAASCREDFIDDGAVAAAAAAGSPDELAEATAASPAAAGGGSGASGALVSFPMVMRLLLLI